MAHAALAIETRIFKGTLYTPPGSTSRLIGGWRGFKGLPFIGRRDLRCEASAAGRTIRGHEHSLEERRLDHCGWLPTPWATVQLTMLEGQGDVALVLTTHWRGSKWWRHGRGITCEVHCRCRREECVESLLFLQ